MKQFKTPYHDRGSNSSLKGKHKHLLAALILLFARALIITVLDITSISY